MSMSLRDKRKHMEHERLGGRKIIRDSEIPPLHPSLKCLVTKIEASKNGDLTIIIDIPIQR